MIDDGLPTLTSEEQVELERKVVDIYMSAYPEGDVDLSDGGGLVLDRAAHAAYLQGGLGELHSGFISLDASRTWICYWITHGLALLGAPLPEAPAKASVVAFIASCQHPEGGFGGGPYQLAHLAPTYAAVCTLVTLGGAAALQVVDRPRLLEFFLRMCVPPERGGGMTMHEGGEVDVRGCYCALAACEMLCLDKCALAAAGGLVDYIRRCQSYEGGIGGEPGNEAHGGYTFCGLAAAALLGQAHALDLNRMLRWAARCQGGIEGGFQGRTNKLVDGCYSLWQGGVFPLLAALLRAQPQQREQQQQGEQPPPEEGASVQRGADAVELVLQSLGDADGGSSLEDWLTALPCMGPEAAAEARQAELQRQLDAAVESSLEAEERYRAVPAGTAAAAPLQQEAVAALETAAELQRALEGCQQHIEALRSGATALVGGSSSCGSGGADPSTAAGEGQQQLPVLYDAAALQLWLLMCCQVLPRGGLRDKPGKSADYYHTCYCLSGLSSSQHYSGVALGGPQNLLARADPLCNVLSGQLEAAQRFFGAGGS